MHAYVMIKMRAGEIPEGVRQLRTVKGVIEATATLGPYDAIAHIEGKDLDAIGRIVTWDIQSIPGVMDTLTCLQIGVN